MNALSYWREFCIFSNRILFCFGWTLIYPPYLIIRVRSCFPTTIITRVLMCGLKDFYLHGSSQPELSPSEEKVPKLASVVGILGHLAAQHQHNIRTALVNLFQVRPYIQNTKLSRKGLPGPVLVRCWGKLEDSVREQHCLPPFVRKYKKF